MRGTAIEMTPTPLHLVKGGTRGYRFSFKLAVSYFSYDNIKMLSCIKFTVKQKHIKKV